MALGRRQIIAGLGAIVSHEANSASMPWISPDLPDGTRGEAHLAQIPNKSPLIQLSDSPPNLESPIQSFRTAITPGDQFYVRYHLAGVPDADSLDKWALEIGGDAAERSVRLTAVDLHDLPQSEIAAVCQCAGNRRGLLQSHVPGVQWGHGAMGCAIWHGPRLRDVLKRAGVKPEAREIWLSGADTPVLPGTPKFQKCLPLDKAMADETIIATSMNGAPLPLLNGFPARVVVPGWLSTYWMKHLTHIEISAKPLDGFWMRGAYRVPSGIYPVSQPFTTQNNNNTWPVTEIPVNALIADPVHGDEVERSGFTVHGVAWDKGSGILRVDVSLDGGATWQSALLDSEVGVYAFRTFRLETGSLPRGRTELRVRAVSNGRESQPDAWRANPGGYYNNMPQRLTVEVV